MKARKIKDGIFLLGAIDWDRRLFDALIPLPDGTSYNAYLIEGGDSTVLVDSVDPKMADILMNQLESVPKIDFVISNHAEQDHSGSIPIVLEKYPQAQVIVSPQGKDLLQKHLGIADDRFRIVSDGETISLGSRTLEFIHTPWVHWPETMVTYSIEDNLLFSCDFFGSHIATTDLYAFDEGRVYEAAKRYYAEIMMPYRKIISKNLAKLTDLQVDIIAPSHGPVYHKPQFILDAYRDWVSDNTTNLVVIPYISMHGSTKQMVDYLIGALADKGIGVQQFDISQTDIGKLAINLVDASTIIIATPTVRVGPHPLIVYATYLAGILRPKAKYAGIIGSYGWGNKTVERIADLISDLKINLFDPVLVKGAPKESDFRSLDDLAQQIFVSHKELGVR
jgi:flavorubredoxin